MKVLEARVLFARFRECDTKVLPGQKLLNANTGQIKKKYASKFRSALTVRCKEIQGFRVYPNIAVLSRPGPNYEEFKTYDKRFKTVMELVRASQLHFITGEDEKGLFIHLTDYCYFALLRACTPTK